MASSSLDDVNVNGENVLHQQMDKDDFLDRVDMLFFFSMGCTAWVVCNILWTIWKYSGFSSRPERFMDPMDCETDAQKVNIEYCYDLFY